MKYRVVRNTDIPNRWSVEEHFGFLCGWEYLQAFKTFREAENYIKTRAQARQDVYTYNKYGDREYDT